MASRARARQKLRQDETGSVLTEALLLLPFLTIFSIGVLEFGNVLWQRHQLQTGVRDAARYWSRCQPAQPGSNPPFYSWCSVAIAQNIAFYGKPNPTGADNPRVPGWTDPADLTIAPVPQPSHPASTDLVTVTGTLDYLGSPLFGALQIPIIEIEYTHTERYVGW
ncbi:TadE/TadG family type IV pilus assembly protein [Actibacterium sp. MT2.3-13A]|uniref:TadE/TadG family type IV pilus assembly protein n=1 Tax=Actibacterium sp. MT2.3-13A TaxID=2828332 RepID=UPI001BA6599B|nr:TadE/TadG family type IV pilus assembly protein [Actibacterium sp. MT2.3-13A]